MSTLDALILSCDNDEYLDALLQDFTRQIEMPHALIIIDNGDVGSLAIINKYNNILPIKYMPQDRNIGVNAGWMLGIWTSKANIISILNDDIRIPPDFFKKIKAIFEENLQIGYVIPLTVPTLAEVPTEPNADSDREPCEREGWAFTIRRDICLKGGPIPEDVLTFYGDDHLYNECKKQEYEAIKEKSIRIFHHFSPTVNRLGVLNNMGSDLKKYNAWHNGSRDNYEEEWHKRFG